MTFSPTARQQLLALAPDLHARDLRPFTSEQLVAHPCSTTFSPAPSPCSQLHLLSPCSLPQAAQRWLPLLPAPPPAPCPPILGRPTHPTPAALFTPPAPQVQRHDHALFALFALETGAASQAAAV